jgi:hypothetical protein
LVWCVRARRVWAGGGRGAAGSNAMFPQGAVRSSSQTPVLKRRASMPVVGDRRPRAVVPFGSKPLRCSDPSSVGPKAVPFGTGRSYGCSNARVWPIDSSYRRTSAGVTTKRTPAGTCRPPMPVADRTAGPHSPRDIVPPPPARPPPPLFERRAPQALALCEVELREGPTGYRRLLPVSYARARSRPPGGQSALAATDGACLIMRVGRVSVIGRAPAVWRVRNA